MPHGRMWLWADGGPAEVRDAVGMRVLIALGETDLLRSGTADGGVKRVDVDAAAAILAEIAAEHDVVITHDCTPRVGHMLELALQNALPDRDVVTVLTQVVVSAEDAALADSSGRSEPSAIVELRSLRTLIDFGALVICTGGGGLPVTIAADGTMRGFEAAIDPDLTAALLARRLDVDQFLLICGPATAETGSKEDAARRFVQVTGRHAAIGSFTGVVRTVRDAVENRVASRRA